MEELIDLTQPDPLLKPGAFIDPNPPSTNGNIKPKPNSPSPSTPNGHSTPKSSTYELSGQKEPATLLWPRPDWLPPDWTYVERVRSSGASAGSRDKYYVEPVSQRKFRSKSEVFRFLETGILKTKRKDSEDSTPGSKRKKSVPKEKDYMKNFNFDDVPSKVKWELMDIYEGTWRPLSNGVDRVPESTKQEWSAAFTYLTFQNACSG